MQLMTPGREWGENADSHAEKHESRVVAAGRPTGAVNDAQQHRTACEHGGVGGRERMGAARPEVDYSQNGIQPEPHREEAGEQLRVEEVVDEDEDGLDHEEHDDRDPQCSGQGLAFDGPPVLLVETSLRFVQTGHRCVIDGLTRRL
jgi:hypothetical protein